jgi:hypothetical protein
MASLNVTATEAEYTVQVIDSPNAPGEWVGLYVAGAAQGQFIAWRWSAATVTFPAQAAGNYDVRLFDGLNVELARADVPGGVPVEPVAADDGFINVESYRVAGEVDDTAMLNRAADACRATATTWGVTKGYLVPAGRVYSTSGHVDLSDIQVIRTHSWINVNYNPVMKPAITCRCSPNTGPASWEFYGFYSNVKKYNHLRQPILSLQGMMDSHVKVGPCDYLEILADDYLTAYNKVAFNNIQLGGVLRLEIRDTGTYWGPWANTNSFYGGRLAQLRIGGRWNNVTEFANNGESAIRLTIPGHGYNMNSDDSGHMVELYREIPGGTHSTEFRLYEIVDADHIDLVGTLFQGPYVASEYRVMGRGRYPHNHNVFHCPDFEDYGEGGYQAIIHIQGKWNHLKDVRAEAGLGKVGFGKYADGNTISIANTSSGNIPGPNDRGPMQVQDIGRENYVGWVRAPGAWGSL